MLPAVLFPKRCSYGSSPNPFTWWRTCPQGPVVSHKVGPICLAASVTLLGAVFRRIRRGPRFLLLSTSTPSVTCSHFHADHTKGRRTGNATSVATAAAALPSPPPAPAPATNNSLILTTLIHLDAHSIAPPVSAAAVSSGPHAGRTRIRTSEPADVPHRPRDQLGHPHVARTRAERL